MTHIRIEIGALLLAAILPAFTFASDRKPLGEVDFFGNKGLDVAAIRAALPFHEGDLFPPPKSKTSDEVKRQATERVKQVIGREPTGISFVCCDSKHGWMVYIGLPGESYQALDFNPAPDGEIRLPKAAITLRDTEDNAWMNAVMKGCATEDDSQGYALVNDPKARRAALAIREYALHNEALIFQVLASSSDARHRAIAAQMVGYGRQSGEQIDALVHASLDVDENVRNDAVQALGVLGGAKPDLARRIPAEPFIRMLRSGSWSDHNKASLLLYKLTASREPGLLTLLRNQALDPLMEMARWRNVGHAEPALSILGRIAGIQEDQLIQLLEAEKTDAILSQFIRP